MTKGEQIAIQTECGLRGKSVHAGKVWEAAKLLGFPAAIWRLPESGFIHLIISLQRDLRRCRPDLEELPPGFLISPFANSDNDEVVFIEGDIELRFPAAGPALGYEQFAASETAEIIFRKALDLAERDETAEGPVREPRSPLLKALPAEGQKERFERIVQLGAEAVRSGALRKVVLSRKKDFEVASAFSPAGGFFRLEQAYPTAFVSLVCLPSEGEIWMGATPEPLVEVTAERHFKTTALAGTQKATDEQGALLPRARIRWGEKEIEEQALVCRYIIECFKKIRLREYLETGPRSVRAGNLYHLRTDFEVDMDAVNFPELGSVMLKLLHPTSAVCGMPKEKATELLSALEGYDRRYYSGFLGPVHIENEARLYVNLRTLSIKDNLASFYAGAGIMADSDPESEWEETELKTQTLLEVLNGMFV